MTYIVIGLAATIVVGLVLTLLAIRGDRDSSSD